MENGGRVVWRIDAESESFNKQVEEAARKARVLADEIDATTQRSTRSFTSLGQVVGNFADTISGVAKATARVGFGILETGATIAAGAIITLGAKGLSSANQLQSLQLSMDGLTHSMTLGAQAMAGAYEYAQTAPFQLPDVAATTKTLIAFGFSTADAVDNLKLLGNISITTGIPLQSLGGIFGQVSAQSYLMLGDIRQLTQNGIAILPALQNTLHKTANEVTDMATRGQISFAMFKAAMETIADPAILELLNNTMPRQIDRLGGSVRKLSNAFVGVNVDAVSGFTMAASGMDQAATTLVKTLADTLRSPAVLNAAKVVGDAIVPIINNITKAIVPVITYVAKLAENISSVGAIAIPVLGLMLSGIGKVAGGIPIIGQYIGFLEGPLGIIAGLLGGLIAASPALQKGLGDAFGIINSTVQSLKPTLAVVSKLFLDIANQLGTALAPVAVELARAFSEILKALVPLVPVLAGGLASALIALIRVITPVLNVIVFLLQAFNNLDPVFKNFLLSALVIAIALKPAIDMFSKFGSSGVILAAQAPLIAQASTIIASGIASMATIIGNALPAMVKAAAGIALVGLAIGIAIASIGAGIFVFGKGMSAIGDGLAAIAKGATILQKTNFDTLAGKVAVIGQAFSNLAPRIFDLAAAALTFPLIGIGLGLMADGLKKLQYVQISSITQKLPALADALKSFRIGIFESAFTGNILSKFKDLGDALANIAKVIDMVSNLKVDPQTLKTSLSNLALGLKAFLIPEIQPSWVNSVFGGNIIKPESVTSYMGSLKDIVAPIQELQKVFTDDKFNAQTLHKNLANLADGLKAFLISEVQPSWVNSVFGNNIIKPASVTKYMDSLGSIVAPITKLQEIFNAKDFKPETLKINLMRLAAGLQAFLIGEIQPSWINATFGSGTLKVSGITDKLKGLQTLVLGLSDLQKLFMTENFDGDKFAKFVGNLGRALQSFMVVDIEKSASFIASSSIKHKGILEYFNNFGIVADGLTKLNDLLSKKDFNSSTFTSFVSQLGQALQAFTVTDITNEFSRFMGNSSKISTQTKGILEYFNNFGILADGIIKLQGLFATKGFQPDVLTNFLSQIGIALQAFGVAGIETKIQNFIGSASEKTTYTTVLEHLGNFSTFADGIATLVNTIFSKTIAFNVTTFTATLQSIGGVLSSFGMYNISISESVLGISTSKAISYTTVLEHIGNFADFATGVQTIITAIAAPTFSLPAFVATLDAIGGLLSSFVLRTGTIEQSVLFISGKTAVGYTTVLKHLGDFSNFAGGIKILADVVGNANFDPGKFIASLDSIFKAVSHLMLKETEATTAGWFGVGSNTKVSYTSIIEKIGDIQGLANAVKTLAAAGIGVGGFDGAAFVSSMTSISNGFKAMLSIGQVDMGAIDVGKLNGVITAITNMRNAITGWDTSGLGAQGASISAFLVTFGNSIVTNITDKSAAMAAAGTTLMTNLMTGLMTGVPQMGTVAASLANAFINGLNTKQSAAQTAGASLQGAMWHGIEPKMKDEYWQGAALAGKLVDGLKSKNAEAYNAGANATQGFINGAASKSAYSTGWNIASTFLQGLKDKGKQGSPWKTTVEIGTFAIEGLTQGIYDSQNGLLRAADSVVASMLDTFDVGKINIAPALNATGKMNIDTNLNGTNALAKTSMGQYVAGNGPTSTVENHIGTITIASEVDAENWLQKLTRLDEVTRTGLTSNV